MLNDLFVILIQAMNATYAALKTNVAAPLFYTLIIIDIAFFGLMIAVQMDADPSIIVKKIITIAVLIFAFNNFSNIANVVWKSMVTLGTKIPTTDMKLQTYLNAMKGQGVTTAFGFSTDTKLSDKDNKTIVFSGPYLEKPGMILEQIQSKVMLPLWDYSDKYFNQIPPGPFGIKIPDWKTLLFMGLTWLSIIALAIVAVIQTVMIRFEFGLVMCGGIVVFPFTAFPYTRFIGAKVWPALISVALKVGILSILVAMFLMIVNLIRVPVLDTNSGDASLSFCLQLMLVSIIFAVGFRFIPHIANTILTSTTGMTAGGFTHNVKQIYQAIRQAFQNVSNTRQQNSNTNNRSTNQTSNANSRSELNRQNTIGKPAIAPRSDSSGQQKQAASQNKNEVRRT